MINREMIKAIQKEQVTKKKDIFKIIFKCVAKSLKSNIAWIALLFIQIFASTIVYRATSLCYLSQLLKWLVKVKQKVRVWPTP